LFVYLLYLYKTKLKEIQSLDEAFAIVKNHDACEILAQSKILPFLSDFSDLMLTLSLCCIPLQEDLAQDIGIDWRFTNSRLS
jgi:hypothetical protein